MLYSIVSVALPVPLRQCFDYYLPKNLPDVPLGARVCVEFGRQTLIGVAIEVRESGETESLKPILNVLDERPVLDSLMMALMQWAAQYYQHPIGEALSTAMPNALRKGLALSDMTQTVWQPAHSQVELNQVPARASQQRKALEIILQNQSLLDIEKSQYGISAASLKALQQQVLIVQKQAPIKPIQPIIHASPLALNQEQQKVIDEFGDIRQQFAVALLEGVTGSGKTEVYLRLIEDCLRQGRQALVLVPEIGLTPQTIERFQRRFTCEMAIFHSNLTDLQRLKYWQLAKAGVAQIIIGTRSAIFTATDNLGLIVIDEEHDLSYKQQDGLRYSARDLACMRAKLENIPIVLGSATPSLETLHNAVSGKYLHWQMWQRAGNAQTPDIEVLDIRREAMEHGIAEKSLQQIANCLQRGEQALLFINRRGFAPSLICHDCGWVGQCSACDARLTVHQKDYTLRCHHCGVSECIPFACPVCQSKQLVKTGVGTERLELALQQYFPATPTFRIDRDTTSQKQALSQMVEQIQQSQAAILIGTQMLAKGHHFPNVTLVVIVDADASLVSTDFRALERFGQLMTQVTGRAGREEKRGKAIIQTHYPQHPQLEKLIHWGYNRFAMDLLGERRVLGLPPFSAQALIRLEDKSTEVAVNSLNQLKQILQGQPCLVIGPMPASLQRRAFYFRHQLLVQSTHRAALKQSIDHLLQHSEKVIKSHRQRWSIDIDPQDMS